MKVYQECCENCLLSPDSIVSSKRRKEIIQSCSKAQTHFICHKASMKDEDVCCKTFYDKFGHLSQLIRIGQRLGMIKFVEQPDSEKLITHRQMNAIRN